MGESLPVTYLARDSYLEYIKTENINAKEQVLQLTQLINSVHSQDLSGNCKEESEMANKYIDGCCTVCEGKEGGG